jgi:hypothetical protein
MVESPDVTRVGELSSPTCSERAVERARQLLSAPSPDAELDRLYPLVVQHHVAPTILERLRCAGGDLAELSVASGLVASLWPFNRVLPELTEGPPGRTPLSQLALAIQRHATHLGAVVQGLSGRRLAEPFVLLHGAALRLLAPGYRRLCNDLDLHTPSAVGGAELVRELGDRWGFVLVGKRTRSFHGREIGGFKLLRTTHDGHELHVDIIAGRRPAKPADPELFERSRMMTLDGRRIRVPSREDMLVWFAARVLRRGHFGLRDVHDAWVLASSESDGTDWSRVLEASAQHGLSATLSRLLAVAEEVNGQIAIEPDVRRILVPSGEYAAVFEANQRWFEEKCDQERKTPSRRRSDEWERLVEGVRRLVAEALPEDAVVLVVNRGDETLLELGKRTGWHYPRDRSGEYAGCYPADSNEAIAELERLHRLGATHLVFPSTERWWLEHYGGFREHLDSHHRQVASATAGIAFQLRDGRRP